jgi:hypothetical protein
MTGSSSYSGEPGFEELAPPEVYDPATGSSTPTARMVVAREGLHTATLLLDDTVLVAGGCCHLAAAELFH